MKKILLTSIIGVLASASASAGENQSYVAFDIGQSKIANFCNGAPATVSCNKTDTAFRIAGGYAFSNNFGVEVSYSDYGKATVAGTVGAVAVSAKAAATAIQIVGTGTLPLNDQFSLTAKAGFAFVNAKASATAILGPFSAAGSTTANNTNAVWGVGAEYAFTPKVSARLNYEDLGKVGNATTGKGKLSSVTVGVVYKF